MHCFRNFLQTVDEKSGRTLMKDRPYARSYMEIWMCKNSQQSRNRSPLLFMEGDKEMVKIRHR